MERKLSRQMRLALKIDVTNGAKVDDGIDVQSHQEQVLRSVRQMQTMQRVSRRLGGIEFMVWQLRYIGKDIWMAQGFTVLLVFTVLYRTIGQTMGNLPARYIPMLLGILAVLTLMVSIPFLQRPYKYRMYEIELATRISLPRILAADLALMTIGNLIVFTVGGILAHGGLEFPMARTWIYLCLPFLAAGGGCARIMKRTQNWEDVQARIGVCEGYCGFLIAALVVLFYVNPAVYGYVYIWGAAVIGMIPLVGASVGAWMKEAASIYEEE